MSFNLDQLVLAPCIAAFGEAAQGNAEPVYLSAQGGSAFAIDGVFDEGFSEVDQGFTGPPVATATPKFGVRLSQFPVGIVPAQGDLVTIRSQAYLVREARPDSHGHVLLLLNETGLTLPIPRPPAGVQIGGYAILEDGGGNLVIRTPDGNIVPLVTQ